MKKLFAGSLLAVACVIAILNPFAARATALTAPRNTVEVEGQYISLTQASNIIYAGSIVALNSSGVAVPASDASGLSVIGRAEVTSDNTGSTYDSAHVLRVKRGVFRWENGGTFTDADIGDFAYVLDDATVFTAALATNDIPAGLIFDVDSDGVWVDTFSLGGQGAASVAALTASGAANLQSTLAVGGTATIGDGGDTVAINSSDWDISTTGAMTGIGAITADGAITFSNSNIVFTLATATNGLATGTLWNDSGTLKIK